MCQFVLKGVKSTLGGKGLIGEINGEDSGVGVETGRCP